MIKISFPDGKKQDFENGIMPIEIAKGISPSLAKKCVCAKFNNELINLCDQINEDGALEFITVDDKEVAFSVLNHSTAHLLAQAVSRLYKGAMMGVGPSIEEGFYYDFDLGDNVITPNDLPKIEEEMRKISKENLKISHSVVTKEEACKLFAADKYKVELTLAIPSDDVNLYQQGDYYEVCRGPHVISTSVIKNFKLLSIAGAYWRGDSKNKQLTRIYGTSWFTKEELDAYLVNIEERKKRDHKKLGKELGLFMISEYGPGLPFWLPNGYTMRRTLEDFWLDLHKANGYKVIETPIMLSRSLWETSGHWDHYHDDMFTTKVDDVDYAIKPMNCPGAILVYKNDLHSYKDLPLRFAELGHVHRNEASGALNGLFRVRTFTQDDAHTLLTEDQIGDEVARILKIYDTIYSIFGLDYKIELSTRPVDNFIGDVAVWDQAEADLAKACKATGHDFKINPGDGAFYGPKLDFKLRDSTNRVWQCGTVQLDMQLPGRFDCTYIAEDGSKKTPVMIHRACFGSIERFIGIITENYAGAFPTWLAPVQVKVIPVNNEVHKEYCDELGKLFDSNKIRYEFDYREEKLGYKIREAQTKKVPYSLVIGDNEITNGVVTYRKYGSQEQVTVSKQEFVDLILKHNKELN